MSAVLTTTGGECYETRPLVHSVRIGSAIIPLVYITRGDDHSVSQRPAKGNGGRASVTWARNVKDIPVSINQGDGTMSQFGVKKNRSKLIKRFPVSQIIFPCTGRGRIRAAQSRGVAISYSLAFRLQQLFTACFCKKLHIH